MVLPRPFYRRPAETVARDLLGCVIVARSEAEVTAGRIVETEAYLGPDDAASHAAFRPGSRARFYGDGGHAYVFRIYGLHFCLNAITGARGEPGCVLIRAVEPLQGRGLMARRRGLPPHSTALTNGPGKLTEALGITDQHNGVDLTRGALVFTRGGPAPESARISVGPRVGITRATELPLRFWISGNPYVSRKIRLGKSTTIGI